MFYFKTKPYFTNIQCPEFTNAIILHIFLTTENNRSSEEARSIGIWRAVSHDKWLGLSWSELVNGITSLEKRSPHSLGYLINTVVNITACTVQYVCCLLCIVDLLANLQQASLTCNLITKQSLLAHWKGCYTDKWDHQLKLNTISLVNLHIILKV